MYLDVELHVVQIIQDQQLYFLICSRVRGFAFLSLLCNSNKQNTVMELLDTGFKRRDLRRRLPKVDLCRGSRGILESSEMGFPAF